MGKPNEIVVATLAQYNSEVISALHAGASALWYRGIGSTDHKLLPGLFRDGARQDPYVLLRLERKMIGHFERSVSILMLPHVDPRIELVAQMQHYGVKTRLLDWRTSPTMGLFFALTSARADKSGVFTDDAAVWILDPAAWTNYALRHLKHSSGVLTVFDDAAKLKGFEPRQSDENDDIGTMHEEPGAVLLSMSSTRIMAQSGGFTVFGRRVSAMEDLFDEKNYPGGCLTKLRVPAAAIKQLKEDLFRFGVNEFMAYPDALGLAAQINREALF